MGNLKTKLQTDTWIAMSWDEYVQVVENPIYEQAKIYYYNGHIRIEMLPVSFDRGQDHVIIIFAVNLFTVIKEIGRASCRERV